MGGGTPAAWLELWRALQASVGLRPWDVLATLAVAAACALCGGKLFLKLFLKV
jgi:hypothetical protein